MKSPLNKRMQGFLVAVVVALVAAATGAATASAGTTIAPDGASVSSGAKTSALTAKQKKAKKKALKKCRKIKKAKKRKACIKKVNKKYKKLAKPKGKTRLVEVRDDYYSPNQLSLKVNDSIKWDWKNVAGSEPHNVSLFGGPAGINPYSFESDLTSTPSYTFTRKFTKPGSYEFVCSLHTLMRMNVKVNK